MRATSGRRASLIRRPMGGARLTAVLVFAASLLVAPAAHARRHRRSLGLELGKPAPSGPDDQGARVRRRARLRGRRLRHGAHHRGLGGDVERCGHRHHASRSTASASWTRTPWSFPAAASSAAPTTAAGRSCACHGPPATRAAVKASWPRTSWPTRPATCCSRTGRSCAPRTVGGPGRGAPRCPARGPRVGTSRPPTSPSRARARAIAATAQGRLYRTTDAAVSWTLVRDDPGVHRGRPLRHTHGWVRGREATACCAPRTAERRGSSGRTGRALSRHPLRGRAHLHRHDAVRPVADADDRRRCDLHLGQPLLDEAARRRVRRRPARRCGGRGRRHRGVGRRRYHLGAARGAPAADVHAHQGGVRVAGVRGGAERDARAHERRRSLVGAARRLHLRGRDRRVVRRRASSATRSTPPARCCAPRMAVSRGRS